MARGEEVSDIRREEEQDALLGYAYEPLGTRIPHYSGDASRQLILVAVGLLLIASPLYGHDLRAELPYEVMGSLAAVGFAALTSPREWLVSVGDALISAVGAGIYASWALGDYGNATSLAFVLRIAIALVFLSAFYFSMKTVRSFSLGQVGRHDRVDDFDTDRAHEDSIADEEKQFAEESERSERFKPWP